MRIFNKSRTCTFIIIFSLVTGILAIPIGFIFENSKQLVIKELGKHAMYVSKNAGENKITIYREPGLNTQ